MHWKTAKGFGVYILLLAILFIMISGVEAKGRRRRRKKNRPQPMTEHRHAGRSGIRPLRKIPHQTEATTTEIIKSTMTTTTAASTPIKKSSFKVTPFQNEVFQPVIVPRHDQPAFNAPQPGKDVGVGGNSFSPGVKELPSPTDTTTYAGQDETVSRNKTQKIFQTEMEMTTSSVTTRTPKVNEELYICEHEREYQRQDEALCGYPAFSNKTQCAEIYCSGRPLSDCEDKAGMIAFGSVTVFLGLLIVIGNSLLPFIVYRHPNMRYHHNYIKVSLAFADMLVGLLLLCSVLPNMLWIRSLSEKGLVNTVQKESNTVTAVLSGSLFVVSFESSLLHLAFLTMERFMAIKWSMRHTLLKASTIGYIIAGIWVVSIFLSFIPAMLPDKFEYTILPVLSFYLLTTKHLPDDTQGFHGPLYGCLTMLLPYTLMVVFCILTGIVVRNKLRASPSHWPISKSRSQTPPESTFAAFRCALKEVLPDLPMELAIYKTLLFMIAAFSLTILPLTIVLIMYNIGNYSCGDYSLAYTLAFFASISNSFVNVIIYTARDKRFRRALLSEVTAVFERRHEKRSVPKRKHEIRSTTFNIY